MGQAPSLPEQRDVAFALGSYEANVRNATTGAATAATVDGCDAECQFSAQHL